MNCFPFLCIILIFWNIVLILLNTSFHHWSPINVLNVLVMMMMMMILLMFPRVVARVRVKVKAGKEKENVSSAGDLWLFFWWLLISFPSFFSSTTIFQQTFKFSLPRLQSCSLLLTRCHCWFLQFLLHFLQWLWWLRSLQSYPVIVTVVIISKREKPMLTVIINMVVDRSQDHSYENRENYDFVKLKF